MNGDFFVRSVDASTNRGHEYVNSVSADTYMSGWLMAAFGRFLPVASLLSGGQVRCTRWSVPMQWTGQMGAIAQSEPGRFRCRSILNDCGLKAVEGEGGTGMS